MAEDPFGIVGKVVLGTYLVEQVVAEGGFAVVYRAFHRGFRARVALKCLKIPRALSAVQREEYLRQFRAEAEVLFRLAAISPTIVRPLHVDSFPAAGGAVPFLALEWLDGWTLDEIIAQRVAQDRPPIGLRKLGRMLTPVARALEQAHELSGVRGSVSVVHRDLKPGNLFVAFIGGEQVVKILDFGISKVSVGTGRVRTDLEPMSFTPAYGAPEQWLPERWGTTGTWTDVWGLALTVVEAAKGGQLYVGALEEMREAILDVTCRPTPRRYGLRVTDDVEAVFQQALAVDPKDRYPTVRSFWDDLLEALDLDAIGQPKWSRREDPRVEGASAEVPENRISLMPRLSGLPPPRPVQLPSWQPSPSLEALEFEPPKRPAEWSVMPGLPPPVAQSLEGGAEPLDGAADSPSRVASPDVPCLEVPAPAATMAAPPVRQGFEEPRAADPFDMADDALDFVDRSTLPPPRPSSAPPASAPTAPSRKSPRPVPSERRHSSAPPDPSARRTPVTSLVAPPSAGDAEGKRSGPIVLPERASSHPKMDANRAAPGSLSPKMPERNGLGRSRPPGAGDEAAAAGMAFGPPSEPMGAVRWERLAPAIVLLALAVLIAMFNQRHASASGGESLSWGPLQATWVALAIFVLAVVLAASSLKRSSDERPFRG